MNRTKSLNSSDLKKIFLLTAVLTVLVAAISALIDMSWAFRFLVFSTLALLNWVALSTIIKAILNHQPLGIVTGLMLKAPVLAVLIILASNGFIEVSSFIVAFNMFFATIFVYLAGRAYFGLDQLIYLPAGERTNG